MYEHRAVGTTLSHEVSKRFGEAGLPRNTIHAKVITLYFLCLCLPLRPPHRCQMLNERTGVCVFWRYWHYARS
jgi:hypothetical protein